MAINSTEILLWETESNENRRIHGIHPMVR